MDFHDSAEEAVFRAEARAFLNDHAPERVDNPYVELTQEAQRAALPGARAWQQTLCDHGWAALLWPERYGGRGLGPIHQVIWNQEQARFGLGYSIFISGIGMAGPTIVAHGTEEQKTRHLPAMLRGDRLWCQLFSEPGAGSDLAGLSARAVRDADDWVITGQKTWSSFADLADWGFLLARTDPSVPKHKGITYFLVDMKSAGIETRPLRQPSGSELFSEVFFNDVRVPDENRLGPEGGGWAAANTTLMHERMTMGGMERQFSFEELVGLTASGCDDLERDELGRIYTWLKGVELLNARIMTKIGRGENPSTESSVMKLAFTRLYSRAAELGLALQGHDAMLARGEWQKHFLTARSMHIAGGSDEIQKNVAAERVLGLPRDPVDLRDVPFDQLFQVGAVMNFAFSEEQEAYRAELRRFVEERWPVSEVRRLMETPEGFDRSLWKQMAQELGLQGIAVAEAHGGQGFGLLEVGIAFEEFGGQLSGGPLLSTVGLAVPLIQQLGDEAQQAEWLGAIAAGETTAGFAVGEGAAPATRDTIETRAERAGDAWRLHGRKRFVIDGNSADLILVVAREDHAEGRIGVFAVRRDETGLDAVALETFDPTRKQADLILQGAAATRVGDAPDAWSAIERTLDLGAIALAAESVGASARCLEMAVGYAKERMQFSRPIGSFQAIKHKASEMLLELELARPLAYWSWWVADNEVASIAEAASLAKSAAGEAFGRAAVENVQIHGGMGYTWEHDAHLYLKRAKTSEILFGTAAAHRARLAASLGA